MNPELSEFGLFSPNILQMGSCAQEAARAFGRWNEGWNLLSPVLNSYDPMTERDLRGLRENADEEHDRDLLTEARNHERAAKRLRDEVAQRRRQRQLAIRRSGGRYAHQAVGDSGGHPAPSRRSG